MMKVEILTGDVLDNALEDVARLRIAVFRDWPYLYDGDLEYEQRYLQAYRASDRAIVIGAYDGSWLVGASTGAPLVEHAADFARAFEGTDVDLSDTFYCAESVLLRRYRKQGIGKRFFFLRELHARELGFKRICFCSVVRSETHPLFPSAYEPLDGFWKSRGYAPLENVLARFSWKDIDQLDETLKPLQFWIKDL